MTAIWRGGGVHRVTDFWGVYMGSAENGGVSIRRPKGAKLVHPPWDVYDTFPEDIKGGSDSQKIFGRKSQI